MSAMPDMVELVRRLEKAGVPFRRDQPLALLTWMGVGGSVPILAEPRDVDDLALLRREALALGVRLETLGEGANVLASDGELPLAVVRLTAPVFQEIVLREGGVRVGAGASLEPLIRRTLSEGLAGLEGLVGIPATVGGALAMNAGSRHAEISGSLRSVTVVQDSGEVREISKALCSFGYRKSSLRGMTVVSAEFELAAGDPQALREKARVIKEEKSRTQPLGDSSAGCIFRNPDGRSAGQLIDSAGLKGLRQGQAQVSDRHANFMVNLGGATADDIRCLIDRVRDSVRRAYGVELELEVVRWP